MHVSVTVSASGRLCDPCLFPVIFGVTLPNLTEIRAFILFLSPSV